MMIRRGNPTILLVLLALLSTLLGGCTSIVEEIVPTLTATAVVDVPAEVTAARQAVLDFLRDGANECVPPAGVRWQATEMNAPAGFNIFRFDAEACEITVTYAVNAEENGYHVALHDDTSGVCWQAVVDDSGRIVRTGKAAETEPGIGNAAAIYCEAQGYVYEIRSEEDGSECGACVFPDGSACKSWLFFHGECEPAVVTGD
jgi:putative hemolysin